MNLFISTSLLFVIIVLIQCRTIESAKKMTLPEVREMMKPMGKSCKTKTGLTDDLVETASRGEFPKVRPLMCYFKCLMTMMKVMNKQGQVSERVLNNQIDALVIEELVPRLKEIGKTCINTVSFKEDSCEYAYDIVLCSFNIDSEMFFLP